MPDSDLHPQQSVYASDPRERYVLRAECEAYRSSVKSRLRNYDAQVDGMRCLIHETRAEQRDELRSTKLDIQSGINANAASHIAAVADLKADFESFRQEFTAFRERLTQIIVVILITLVITMIGVLIGRSIDFSWIGIP